MLHMSQMGFFSKPIQHTVHHLEMMRDEGKLKKCDYLFLVGGFANSDVLK